MTDDFGGGLISDDDWWESEYFDEEDYRNVHGASNVGDFSWDGQDMWNTSAAQSNDLHGLLGGGYNAFSGNTPNETGVSSSAAINPMTGLPMQTGVTPLSLAQQKQANNRVNANNTIKAVDVRPEDGALDKALEFGKDALMNTVGRPAMNWYGNLQKAIAGGEEYNPNQAAAGQAAGNFMPSLATEAGGIVDMVSSPIETGQAVIDLLSGTLQHVTGLDYNQNDKNMASAVGNAVLEDYGSIDGFTKTLSERPVEALAMLTGAGFITKAVAHQALKAADPVTMNKVFDKTPGLMGEPIKDIIGHHSSPYKFDKPDPSKFNSGLMGKGHYMYLNEKSAADYPGAYKYTQEITDNINNQTINWGGSNSAIVNNAFKDISNNTGVKFADDFHAENYFTLVDKFGEDATKNMLRERGVIGNREGDTVMMYNPDDVKMLSRNGEYIGGIDNPMIVQHNVSPESLIKQKEGLPMPSMAIANANNPLTKYGDISLIGDKNLVDKRTNIHSSDMYSGRQPGSRLAYSDLDDVAKQVDEATLNYYGFYTVDDLTPGRLESRLEATKEYVEEGYLPDDYKSFSEMRRAATGDRVYIEEPYIDPKDYLGETHYTLMNKKGQEVPWNPEDAMKAMRAKKAHLPGTEGLKGPGQARALASEKLKNISEVKENRNKLTQKKGQDEQFKTIFKAKHEDAMEDVGRIAEKLGESYEFGHLDRYADIIESSLKGESLAWTGWPADEIAKVKQITDDLKTVAKTLDTEYFEAKSKRLVDISEFKGAIIPKDATDAEKLLIEKGIEKILKYGDEKERVALFKQFPERYFAAAPIGLMGLDEESIAVTGEGLNAPTDALLDLLGIEEEDITERNAEVDINNMTEEELKEYIEHLYSKGLLNSY